MNINAAAITLAPATWRARAVAYFELTKPRVVTMVLIATLAGFYMGCGADFDLLRGIKVLCGTALAAGGTLALNQYFERGFDAIMHRTRYRPLPSGRLRPGEALVFGITTGCAGIAYLFVEVNPLSALIACLISLFYLGGYTPMKRVTWLCHIIGGVPGALPPVIGWAAARGTLNIEALVLFGIMLLWQLPHSLSIARLYQEDYARAGLSLLPLGRATSNPVNAVIIAASTLLVGVGTLPTCLGIAGRAYLVIASVSGLWMLLRAIRLVGDDDAPAARNVMLVSLVYLPVVLLTMVLDKM